MTDEVQLVLREAREEIVSLRRANEAMHSQLRIVDLFERLVMGHHPTGAGIDVVWRIDQALGRHGRVGDVE